MEENFVRTLKCGWRHHAWQSTQGQHHRRKKQTNQFGINLKLKSTKVKIMRVKVLWSSTSGHVDSTWPRVLDKIVESGIFFVTTRSMDFWEDLLVLVVSGGIVFVSLKLGFVFLTRCENKRLKWKLPRSPVCRKEQTKQCREESIGVDQIKNKCFAKGILKICVQSTHSDYM